MRNCDVTGWWHHLQGTFFIQYFLENIIKISAFINADANKYAHTHTYLHLHARKFVNKKDLKVNLPKQI